MWSTLVKILIVLLVAVSTTGLIKFKSFGTATKFILLYVIVATLSECIAYYYAVKDGDNILVYNIYPIAQLIVITLFFNQVHKESTNSNIALWLAPIGAIFYVINFIFFQNIKTQIVTNFLVIEAVLIVFMCLHFMYLFFKKSNYSLPILTPSFIIICILLLYWSFTYFYWLTGMTIRANNNEDNVWIRYILWTINFLKYLSLGLVFVFYKKLQPKHG